jgi:gluconokinase
MSSVLDELVDGVEPAPEIVSLFAGTKRSLVLSLDIGTSGVRAAFFDNQGTEVNGVRIGRRASSLNEFTELDPDIIVDEVIQAIDELIATTPDAGKVELIAISAFWHSLLGIDTEGSPTTPLLTWADTRATRSAKAFRSEFNENDIHLRTGCRFHSSYWPAKLRWLRTEQPQAFARTATWLGLAEYLCRQLFDELVVSVSMASATGLLNQRTCDWDWDFVEALNISANALPAINHNINVPVAERFIGRWPALVDARLTTIVGDGAANNIGGGCSTNNKIALMIGTSGAMRVVFEAAPPAQLSSSLWCYRIDRRRVVVGGALSDGGGLYRWLRQSLAVEDDSIELGRELESIEPDSHGLTILPFWSGERSTGWSGDARGAILGLTQQTKPAEIVRAALESIAYRFALIALALDELAPDAQIVATGNALRSSPVWLQIIADVLGRPVMFGGSPEASIRGAALLALEAVGKIGAIQEVAVSVDEVFEPNMDRHARYQLGLERQEEIYRKLVS